MKTPKPHASGRLDRRTFLKRSAAAAVTALVPPLNNRITVGFIGTGRQCVYANIPGFMQEPDAQCVAVWPFVLAHFA
jgi:hypothetical protein